MKKIKLTILTLLLCIAGVAQGNAQGLSDLFGGDSGSNILGNLLEGVFTSSKITVADMEGTWVSTGPAISFKGEGFLKAAGGLAAAATIESKLAPYYKQYGLNGAVVTIDKSGNLTLTVKGITLRGSIADTSEQGVFDFSFTAMGAKIGTFKTYIEKSSSTMDMMFDATKLKTLVSAIANFSGNTMAKTMGSLLDSYDGLCVGFKLERQKGSSVKSGATNKNSSKSNTGKSTNKNTKNSSNSKNNKKTGSTSGMIEEGIEFLRGLGK